MRYVEFRYEIVERFYTSDGYYDRIWVKSDEKFHSILEIWCDLLRNCLNEQSGGVALRLFYEDGRRNHEIEHEQDCYIKLYRNDDVIRLHSTLNIWGRDRELLTFGATRTEIDRLQSMREYYIRNHLPERLRNYFLRN